MDKNAILDHTHTLKALVVPIFVPLLCNISNQKKISLQLSFAPKIKSIALVDPSKSLRKVGGKRF